jgi:hypothetical protein
MLSWPSGWDITAGWGDHPRRGIPPDTAQRVGRIHRSLHSPTSVIGMLYSHPDDASGFVDDGLAGGGDLVVECFEGGDVDFGESGEGLDGVAEHVQRHTGADGERGLL